MKSRRNDFTEWLNFHPSIEEIARAVATEYLNEFSVLGVRISQSNSDNSLLLLGQFGYTQAEQEARAAFPDAELQLLASPDLTIINDGHKIQWDPTGTYFVAALRDRGVTHGFLVIEFKTTVPDSDRIAITERIDSFASQFLSISHFKTVPNKSTLLGLKPWMNPCNLALANFLPANCQFFGAWLKERQTTN